MADDYVQLQPNSTGNKVDCSVITVGLNAVDRQRIILSDNLNSVGHAAVINGTPSTEYGLVVRQAGTISATISGTTIVTIGDVVISSGVVTASISGTPTVTFGIVDTTLSSSIPTGNNVIGTVSANIVNTPTVTFGSVAIGGTSTVTFGSIATGTNAIGSVSAAITNTPTVTFGTSTVTFGTVSTSLAAGANQIGSVTATISGTPTITFGTATVTFGPALSQGYTGNFTAAAGNPLQIGILDSANRIQYVQGDDQKRILIAGGGTLGTPSGGYLSVQGAVTATISGTPTVTFGTSTVTFGVAAATINAGSNQIGSVTATISGTPTVTFGVATVTHGSVVIASGTITANIGIMAKTANVPTQSSVTGATSSTQLLASNANRIGAWIWNDASTIAYINIGGVATTGGAYSFKISPQGLWEMPTPMQTVTINHICDTGVSGSLRVTELT